MAENMHFNTFLFFPPGPMCDLLWSDPQPQVDSHQPNMLFRFICQEHPTMWMFWLEYQLLYFFLFYAEWPFHQQAGSELSVWARCDGTIPQPEQAGLHRAKSWGQSWGLRGHSFREVHHRVFSTKLLVGINARWFLSHLLQSILTWLYSSFSQWSDGKQRSLYPPQGIRPQARVSPVHCCGESPVLPYSCF